MNHPSEATETPIEIQLSTLRKTLGDDLIRDLEDSVAPNTWRAYRSDLVDFATWVAYTSAEWKAPEVVAAYLRTLEDGGTAYATITRRLTSIHKLVAIDAIAAGDLDYEDPTKHPRVGVTLQAIRRRLSTDQDQAAMLPITKVRRVPTPMYPRTRPAVAIPRPTCVPCEALIWPCARWPKITANTDPIQKSQRMPSTNDATARPLDRALSVAAVLPSASRMVNPFSIERWTRLGTNRQTDPLQRGATSSTISRPRERIGVFGAFAAGRVCHRSQEPRDRRGRHHAPHPAQERPDHAPLRPNLRAVDPQCHHRREPLIAAEPAPVPPLSAYVAKRCPRRVQLDLVAPAEPNRPPTCRCDSTKGSPSRHPSWRSCGQWPGLARTLQRPARGGIRRRSAGQVQTAVIDRHDPCS